VLAYAAAVAVFAAVLVAPVNAHTDAIAVLAKRFAPAMWALTADAALLFHGHYDFAAVDHGYEPIALCDFFDFDALSHHSASTGWHLDSS
jgi:hypothetical protein